MIVEAYTTLENTMKYYGNKTKPGAHMPFNFILTNLNDQSKAVDFNDSVLKWLDNMPEGKWANWVVSCIVKKQLKSYLYDHKYKLLEIILFEKK